MSDAGILASDLTFEQKLLLNKLIVAYLSTMPDEVAKARMKKITQEDMNAIRFGWVGGLTPGIPHYYRIQGAHFLLSLTTPKKMPIIFIPCGGILMVILALTF